MINVKFYQYWIILIVVVLVLISIFNIVKMIALISESKDDIIPTSKELNSNIRNLLISIALLSLTSLIYIILIFKNM